MQRDPTAIDEAPADQPWVLSDPAATDPASTDPASTDPASTDPAGSAGVEPRQVRLEGACNVRDLGGYPTDTGQRVRWGVLYRGDSPHRLTATDAAMLQSLGIRSAVDLRRPEEARRFGSGPIPGLARHWLHAPLRPGPELVVDPGAVPGLAEPDLTALYRGYLTHSQPELAAIVSLVACEQSLPALFFCFAGKDRTGLVAALLLSLLGVPDEVVALDYACSGAPEVRQRFAELAGDELAAATGGGLVLDSTSPLLDARAETMTSLLAWFRSNFGDAASFFTSAGVAAGTLERCREVLLELLPVTAQPAEASSNGAPAAG
jgi:protein-tyrosine phosphatase